MAETHTRASTARSAAYAAKPLCTTGPRPKPTLPPNVLNDPNRARAIIQTMTKWANKTVLHYAFMDPDGTSHYAVPKRQADAIRQAFATWKAVGIGLEFKEIVDLAEAEVRIGYSEADGSSASSVGRDVLRVPLDEPTTVYGWDLTSHYGRGTALHEIGHVLGMEHEHQSPFAGITWHDEAVYASLGAPPNSWSRATTFHNILEKLDPSQVQGSAWDPDSIMEYEFGPGLIDLPEKYDAEGLTPPAVLSGADREWVQKWYPAETAAPTELKPFQTVTVNLQAGQQIDLVLKPEQSRRYTIATQGASDTLLTLFEQIDGEPRFLAADDDSGEDRNARIQHKLFKGRTYFARLRLYYPGQTGMTAVLVT